MRRGADFIVNIDGDGQFNPADIAKLAGENLLRAMTAAEQVSMKLRGVAKAR